ncbi:MAG: acyl carrier protein [Fuerstiella sp.]|jgi:acyl carrier protein
MENENSQASDATAESVPTVAEIRQWIINQLAAELNISPDRINVDQPILSCGIDSMQVVSVVAKLEDWLGVRFSENPLEDHATIEALSQYVANIRSDMA